MSFKIHSLHPQTQRVFAALAACSQTQGYLLIGGTALALHIAHRQSNDLDFLFHDTSAHGHCKLPIESIDQVIAQLKAQGHRTDLIIDSSQESVFRINTGERLTDYVRDYSVDSVKVTFFAASARQQPKRFHFWQNAPRITEANCHFQVLSLDALKIAKTLVLQDRVRSRDLFDLMVLMKHHNYNIESLFANISQYADRANDGETERLILRGLIPLDRFDEGLAALNVSTLMPEIYDFFSAQLTEFEAKVHEQHLRDFKRQLPS